MAGERTTRVANLIRAEISNLLLTATNDARLSRVIITDVRVSGDLRHAKVFFTIIGEDGAEKAREEAEAALESAVSFFRRHLGKGLRMKHTPSLVFLYDETLDRARAMEELLDKLS
jgi:ribosome-binding factor A